MVQLIVYPLEDFPLDHPALQSILSSIGDAPQVLLVLRKGNMPAGSCYTNVDKNVKNSGGSIIFGWMIEWFPGVFINAMHHAVWQRPDGSFIDVTAPQNRIDTEGAETTFVVDSTISVNLDAPLPVTDRHAVLVKDKDLLEAIKYYRINNNARRELLETAAKDPRYVLSPAGLSGPPPNETYPKINSTMNDSFSKIHFYRRRVLRRYSK
ncbi:hypothetical protein [Methylobacterium sp. Leaf93]|uniref:hypothetical protein n=1 Tax=Methylobacterium sp. Leaf93 TaxID=1736249 RepID=UPI000A44AAA9|nr:hypothetical protein [Methylobacterium sp. Leaf93]